MYYRGHNESSVMQLSWLWGGSPGMFTPSPTGEENQTAGTPDQSSLTYNSH